MILKKKLILLIKNSNFFLHLFATIYSCSSIISIKGKHKNQISIQGAFLKNTRIVINGQNNRVHISKENRLNNCKIYIQGNYCSVEIENHCILSNLELWVEDNCGKIQIGFLTTIEGGHIAVTEGGSVKIGQDCMFSHAIVIRNGDSHTIINQLTNQRINNARDVQIGDHVWLGEGVKVLKGANIDSGAIIAAGAIVSGKIDNNSINAGIPAKKINDNIHWIRERK